jgi:hypothetical protein
VAETSTDGLSFQADSDSVPLLVSLNHETYHFIQTLCTGYMRRQARRKHALVTLAVRRWSKKTDPTAGFVNGIASRVVRWLAKDADELKRVEEMTRALFLNNQLSSLKADASRTLVGQASPETLHALRAIDAEEDEAGPNGVSPRSVVEGGAMTYQYLLSFGRERGKEKLVEEWDHMPDSYQASFLFARARFPAFYFDLMLPCTALALCYERPGDAFGRFVQQLGTSGGSDALTRRARDLYLALPRLTGNRVIGRAKALRKSLRLRPAPPEHDVYDAAAATLADAEDEFRLLTDAGAASNNSGVMHQIVLACENGSIPATGREPWVLPRLILATLTLQTAGAPRWRREAERHLGEWGGNVIRRAFGGQGDAPSANTLA